MALADGIARAYRYLSERFSSPKNETTIRFFDSRSDPRPSGARSCCGLIGRDVYFDRNAPLWPPSTLPEPLPADARFVLAAHEYLHAWQIELGCLPISGAPLAPAWFIEGMAEYLAYQTAITQGFADNATASAGQRLAARSSRQFIDLPRLEAQRPTDPILDSPLDAIAVELLVQRAGLSSLQAFCIAVGAGQPWRAAFQDVFGVDVAGLYADVDRSLGVDPAVALRTVEPAVCPPFWAEIPGYLGGRLETRAPDATPWTTPQEVSLRLVRRYAPGELGVQAPAGKILYAFCLDGMDGVGLFNVLTAGEREGLLRTRANTPDCVQCVPANAFFGVDRRYEFVLAIDPSTADGSYELRIRFPDGLEVSTTFAHRSR